MEFFDDSMKLFKSFNYNYVFMCMKYMYLKTNISNIIFKDEDALKEALKECAKLTAGFIKTKVNPKYLSLKYYYAYSNDGSKAIVVELPKPIELECECNYFALYIDQKGEKKMYTSEYYKSDNIFKLCEQSMDRHSSYSTICNTLDEFLKAIDLEILDNIVC